MEQNRARSRIMPESLQTPSPPEGGASGNETPSKLFSPQTKSIQGGA